jgi:large subunit ribosomal protein L5
MAYASLHDRLTGNIPKALHKDLGIKNAYALPRIEKVVINVGINKTKMDSKEMQEYISESLMLITGQKPVFTKARKAISNFKTREGMVVGVMLTMRGRKMEEFLDRLISYVLPRARDFRGLSTKMDGHGNYAIGIRDHSIFPEVPPPDAKQIFGMQIQIKTTTESDEEARALLKQIGVPFRPSKDKSESNGPSS